LSGKINHTGRGGKSYEIAELAAEVGILRDRVEASISPWNGESGMQRTGLVTMRARSAHALHAYAFLRTAFRERAAPFAARGCERGPIPPHNKGSSRRLGASGRFILSRDAGRVCRLVGSPFLLFILVPPRVKLGKSRVFTRGGTRIVFWLVSHGRHLGSKKGMPFWGLRGPPNRTVPPVRRLDGESDCTSSLPNPGSASKPPPAAAGEGSPKWAWPLFEGPAALEAAKQRAPWPPKQALCPRVQHAGRRTGRGRGPGQARQSTAGAGRGVSGQHASRKTSLTKQQGTPRLVSFSKYSASSNSPRSWA
jgi:hypothetical protein